MKEYMIELARSQQLLAERLNNHARDGWEPKHFFVHSVSFSMGTDFYALLEREATSGQRLNTMSKDEA